MSSELSPLLTRDLAPLVWDGPFTYPNMVRIGTPGDGSCLFHAIAKAYSAPYKLGVIDGIPLNRGEFIRNLRTDLAKRLAEPINPLNPSGTRYYDTLGRGEVAKLAKEDPNYSLGRLQSLLDSSDQVGYEFLEHISTVLNKDIYVLSLLTRDVYFTGDTDETSTLYRGRPSIVLLSMGNHFELVGVRDPQDIRTLFKPDHQFILSIRDRLKTGPKKSNP